MKGFSEIEPRKAWVFVGLLAIALWAPLVLPAHTLAQATSASADENIEDEALEAPPPGTVSCFDYYSFGSVQAKLDPSVPSTVSGTNITFSGTLENANPYPVVDGTLYVKVFKKRGTTNDGNGPDVIDQFFVKEGIAIPAEGVAPVTFNWRVPGFAQSGEYSLAAFFTTSHKFNLLGLTFTDDVVGNTVPFKVVGEQEASVQFDKASVTVNNAKYHFAAFPPRVREGPVTLQAMIGNTTGMDQQAKVSWTVYQWDAQREENAVQKQQTTVTVPAQGSAPVSIVIQDARYPVYLVVGTLSWKDTKSIIGARFVRQTADSPRLNFPGVSTFPLKGGEGNTLFSCLHNAGEKTIPDGRLELSLADKSGKVIAEHTYEGEITSSMMGVAEAFTPARDYDYVVLSARLSRGGQMIDETDVVYDCKAIDPSQCLPQPVWFYYVLGGLFIVILAYLGIKVRAAQRRVPDSDAISGNTGV